ncbi:fatty acid hydroxylase superfamily-domain-containing protein [Podospora australis]|uniref:Fatty acid hydroxylase superfamily-domain-containing protein n=1 Tax=Podospora australis TaxID=1536484 RepID=A0AAN6X6D4_9PEZI|nr:fatty acid hydroxylase superfamily-domain-containing protein [Podospora australis]
MNKKSHFIPDPFFAVFFHHPSIATGTHLTALWCAGVYSFPSFSDLDSLASASCADLGNRSPFFLHLAAFHACHTSKSPTMATTYAALNQTIAGLASTASYATVFDEVSKYNVHLNIVERLWASWYLWMQNDTIATGIMSFVMHEVVYFGRSLPWMIIDAIPYFNKWKLQNTKVPTWKEQWECAALVLLSHCTVELPQIWLFHPVATYFGMDYGVPFPPIWKMAMQITIFFIMEDAWHYWFHRALHYGPLYKNIHKLHHTYSAPFGLAAEYASPIEVMLLGFGIVGSPVIWVLLTGELHLMTMYMWIILRLFQAIDAHSGYDFPWSLRHWLPFWAGADHHDMHHERFIGNYASSFRWWDYCLDTEAGDVAAKKRREKKLAAIKAKKAQ